MILFLEKLQLNVEYKISQITKRGKVSLTLFRTLQNYGSIPNHPQI